MKLTTAINHKKSALSAISSLFACARIMGMQSQEMDSAFMQILADRKGLPRYMQEYLRGIYDAGIAQCYKDSLVHGGFYNGRFYSTVSRRPDYYAGNGIEPAQWAELTQSGAIKTGFFWITCQTFKPFYVSE